MSPDDPRHGREAGHEQHLRDGEEPCAACVEGDLRASRRRHKRKTMGRVYTLPLGQANHDKLTNLRRKGATWDQLAEWVGVSDSVIWRLIDGGPEYVVYARTYARVRDMKPGRIVTAVGVARRLQALAWLGYTSPVVAAESGVHEETIRDARNGTLAYLHATTAAALADTYDRLWTAPAEPRSPHSSRGITRSRNHARRKGWLPPLAWDDIDDPAETRDRAELPARAGRPMVRHIHVEDAEWLADTDESLSGACRRLGIKPDALRIACKRVGRLDIYDRLADREPNAPMRAGVRASKRSAA